MSWKRFVQAGAAGLLIYGALKRTLRRRKVGQSATSRLFCNGTRQVDKMPSLAYLIDNESFIICPFQSTDYFIKHCKERGIETSRSELEQLEKAGYFYPIARAPQNVFWFRDDHTHVLFKDGLIWQPATRRFQPWESFRDKKGQRQIENFYSVFQIYPYYKMRRSIEQLQIKTEKLVSLSLRDLKKLLTRIYDNKERILDSHRSQTQADVAAAVCQAISNRYFPYTQSDRRTMRVTSSAFLQAADWDKYRRQWDPKSVLTELGLDLSGLERLCHMVEADAREVDPMEKWHELIRFVSVEKKQQLKGRAQLALTLYAMNLMLSLFYKDLTGKEVSLRGVTSEDQEYYYGTGVSKNLFEYLRYLVNEFHLNPKPALILVVEGDGESNEFPRLAQKVFGEPFAQLGIEVRNLKGVSNFAGKKSSDKYGALEKFIDYNHDKQTYVFVILDNEGRAPEVKAKLITKTSEMFPKRTVTREEYIYLWKHSIERDNFDSTDIAKALTDLCENYYTFKADEVDLSYDSGKGDPLEDLVDSKTHGACVFSKVKLLEILCGYIISASEQEFKNKWSAKPILLLLNQVLMLAGMNFQPQDQETWRLNQESGFFGHVTANKENETREYLRLLRARF